MSTSQNGWAKDPSVVRIFAPGDASGAEVREGDVATVFLQFLRRYNKMVEPIFEVHGYRSSAFNDSIAGSIKSSDHTSATAVDVNGQIHLNEAVFPGNWTSGYNSTQIAAVRNLLAEFGGLIQWGLDFPPGYRDPMHFAIEQGVTAQQIANLASSITGPHPDPIDPNFLEEDMKVVKYGSTFYQVTPLSIQPIDQNQMVTLTTIYGPAITLDGTGWTCLNQAVQKAIVDSAKNLHKQFKLLGAL